MMRHARESGSPDGLATRANLHQVSLDSRFRGNDGKWE
jgi:hypothetical protein